MEGDEIGERVDACALGRPAPTEWARRGACVVDVDGRATECGLSGERSKRFFIHASTTYTLDAYVRPFASFPSLELTCCSLMAVEKRRTVELRHDGGWTIRRRRAVRSNLGRWLDTKGRGVDGGRTQSLGAGVGADFAGTTHVAGFI
jgi:hypothetical protein